MPNPKSFRYLIIFYISAFVGCKTKPAENIQQNNADLVKGKQLSVTYCGSCHLVPDPSLLDKNSWRNVLPVMQKRMKIATFNFMAIQNYYESEAPGKLEQINNTKLDDATTQFEEDTLFNIPVVLHPNITLLEYDSDKKILGVGSENGDLYILGKNNKMFKVNNIPIDIQLSDNSKQFYILGIGNLYPSEEPKGQLIQIDSLGNSHIIIDSLIRPVHFLMYDFNDDKSKDFLISSFGSPGEFYSGKLSLFTSSNGVFQEHVIKELPGALKTIIGDFNSDGKTDILGLFSQGRESIIMFLNKGNLEFEEKVIAEFPPSYGTNSFILEDINNDSYKDIICTQGDNGDLSPVSKNYHGVRILINDGKNNYHEDFFFPINGASKVIANDFDKDNDLDLVILANFPDLKDHPQASLVYLENKGDLTFNSSYIEKQPSGKWLLIATEDFDQDGYMDLIVSANLMKTIDQPAAIEQKWKTEKKALLYLKNKGKSNTPFWKRLLN